MRLALEDDARHSQSFRETKPGFEVVEEQVFENERYLLILKWTSRTVTDPKRFSLRPNGMGSSETFPSFELSQDWEWEGPWTVDKPNGVDPNEGWSYALDFSDMRWPPIRNTSKKTLFTTTRQRRWFRRRIKAIQEDQSQKLCYGQILGVIAPGNSLPLPLTWSKNRYLLQVRPVMNGGRWHDWNTMAYPAGSQFLLSDLHEGLFYEASFPKNVVC